MEKKSYVGLGLEQDGLLKPTTFRKGTLSNEDGNTNDDGSENHIFD